MRTESEETVANTFLKFKDYAFFILYFYSYLDNKIPPSNTRISEHEFVIKKLMHTSKTWDLFNKLKEHNHQDNSELIKSQKTKTVQILTLIGRYYIRKNYDNVGWFAVSFLWHINLCRLFNGKYIVIQIISSILNDSI